MGFLREYKNMVVGTIMFFISIYAIYSAFCPIIYAIVVSLIGWILCCLFRQTTQKIKFVRYYIWVCLLCANAIYSDYLMEHFEIATRGAMLKKMITLFIAGGVSLLILVGLLGRMKKDVEDDRAAYRAAKKATEERIRNNPHGCPKCGCNYQILIGYDSDGDPYKCGGCGH